MARSQRFIPFGGNKRTALRNQELRAHANEVHELTQTNLQLAERNKELHQRVQELDHRLKPPMAALARVVSIPTAAAIKLRLVDPIVEIHRWMESGRLATGNPPEIG